MKKYLLDTNICIHFLRGQYSVADKIKEVGAENCYISEITVAELKFGEEIMMRKGLAGTKHSIKDFLAGIKVLPISRAIDLFAQEKAKLQILGKPNGSDFDLLIASTSITYGMTMVTENVRHFENVDGISVENWIRRDSEELK